MIKKYFLLSSLLISQIYAQEINTMLEHAYESVLLSAVSESLKNHKGHPCSDAIALFSAMSEEQKNIRLKRKDEVTEYVEKTYSEYMKLLQHESSSIAPYINKEALRNQTLVLLPAEKQEAYFIGIVLEQFIKMNK